MFEELGKYRNCGQFNFKSNESLKVKCNAPKNESGIYLVFGLMNDKEELIYVGSSGKMQKNGTLKHRQGGLFDRIVNGIQFNGPRYKTWPLKMNEENIKMICVHWFVTFKDEIKDIPAFSECIIIQRSFKNNGCLPRWNEEF